MHSTNKGVVSGQTTHNTSGTPWDKYDAAVDLAGSLCAASIVFLLIPDDNGNFLITGKNITVKNIPIGPLADHILTHNHPLAVANATKDPSFKKDEWVTGAPHIKGFAGVPILSDTGIAIGCIAVADTEPRIFTEKNIQDLTQLSTLLLKTVKEKAKKQDRDEAIFRNYFDHIDDVVFIISPEKKVMAFNALAEKYILLDHGTHIKAGDDILMYVDDPLKESFNEHFNATLTGEGITEEVVVFSEQNQMWWQTQYDLIRKDKKIIAVALRIRNITARRSTERMLEDISNVSKVGGWAVNLQTGKYKLSAVTEEIIGLPKDFELNVDAALNFFKAGESRETFTVALNGAMKKGDPFDIEVKFITYTGRELWVRVKGETESKDGEVLRMFGTFQDVTEKREIYEKLLVSQQYYKSLFDHNPDAIFALDLNEKFISANESMAKLADTSAEEMTGKSFAPFCPPEDAESVMYYFNEAQKGNAVNYDCGLITASGKRREVSITNMPIIINNTVVAIYGIAKDMSDQLAARNLVLKSEANLKTIFENTEVGYILLSVDLRIISFNKPAQDYTLSKGLPPLEENNIIISHPDTEHRMTLPEIAQHVLAGEKVRYDRNINAGTSASEWYNITFHPVRGEEQHVLGIMVEIENITARKLGELELSQSMNLLNEQNKRLMNFSYITSHNLRSHTSNIKSIVSFMEEAESEEEKTEMLEYLKTVSNSLDETIHNLNDVVSINNSVNLIYRPLFLIEFVSKATDLLKEQIILKHAIIDNKLLIDATVNYNPAFLESIMLNFLSNALKYSHPERRPVITLDSYMENGQFVLTIADNGIGIDLEKNGDKLFGFYKTFNGNSDARGLGLFICKNQVEYMGGKIEVESELGKGTTFKIFFK